MQDAKRSQVTLFIIVAILFVVFMISVFIFKDRIFGDYETSETSDVHRFVDECVEETANNAIEHIGFTGGFFRPNELSTREHIAYYYANKRSFVPEKRTVEKEIEKYIDEMLFFCTSNFVTFTDHTIVQKSITTNVEILDDRVEIRIRYPLTITIGNKNYKLEEFRKIVFVRLGVIHRIAGELARMIEEDSGMVCLNCIEKIMKENDVIISAIDSDDKTWTFYILDSKNKINGEDYAFYFAGRFLE